MVYCFIVFFYVFYSSLFFPLPPLSVWNEATANTSLLNVRASTGEDPVFAFRAFSGDGDTLEMMLIFVISAMFRVLTLNVKCLNSNSKKRVLLQELRDRRADVALLQETHFGSSYSFHFVRRYFPLSFKAPPTNKKLARVAILFARHVPFQLDSTYADPSARFKRVQGRIGTLSLALCNVYSPTTSQSCFLDKVLRHLFRTLHPYIIIAGDLNMPMSFHLDQHTLSTLPTPRLLDM